MVRSGRAERQNDKAIRVVLESAIRGSSAPTELDLIDADSLALASAAHGLDHVLLGWLAHSSPKHPAVTALMVRSQAAAIFNIQVLAALQTVLDVIGPEIPFAVFKGPVLAHLVGTKHVRPYGDLDLMVAPQHFETVFDRLVSIGATPFPEGSWQSSLVTEHAQIPLVLSFGVGLDLHAHLCSRPQLRSAFSIDSAARLLERRRSMDIGIADVPVLGLEDMVLHTVAHAGWSGGDRLGWLIDTDAVVRSGDVDWDIASERARSWGIEMHFHDVLRRTVALLGTDVPREVLARSGGRSTSLVRLADRFEASRGLPRERAFARILRSDLRQDLRSTVLALAGRYGAAADRRISIFDRNGKNESITAPTPMPDEHAKVDYLAFIASLDHAG